MTTEKNGPRGSMVALTAETRQFPLFSEYLFLGSALIPFVSRPDDCFQIFVCFPTQDALGLLRISDQFRRIAEPSAGNPDGNFPAGHLLHRADHFPDGITLLTAKIKDFISS